jgi:hypothetical protein
MNKYLSTIVKHWKSTITGLLIGTITLMYYLEKIDTQEWIIAIGGIATIAGMVSKDPDKTASKTDL